MDDTFNERYILPWPNFSSHVTKLLSELYTDRKYADVTIVSDDDNTQFRAHKFVLCACSSVLQNRLDNNLDQSEITLEGISKYEIESVLQFMYLGEATFYPDRMNELLNAAKDLNINEIGKHLDSSQTEQKPNRHADVTNTKTDTRINVPEKADESGKVQGNIIDHSSDDEFVCKLCGHKTSTKESLNLHKDSVHRKYSCKLCEFRASKPGAISIHNRFVHKGITYPCDKCDLKEAYGKVKCTYVEEVKLFMTPISLQMDCYY